MAKIYSPNNSYTGISASVIFADGAGETSDPALIAWFKAHGYRVEEPAPAAALSQETVEAIAQWAAEATDPALLREAIEREQAGKARKTALEALAARLAALEMPAS